MKELSEVLQDWEAVIGLEIHTELTALDTKMFCNCKLSHDDEPNANVCPVCLGLPGALPVPNKRAIESIVKAGLATNCEIQRHSMFYRKHYFYPDMAKNFQTTQGPVAFAMYGHLDLDVTGRGAAERPDCAFGEAEAQSLASASANAEGLSTSMTSTMREGNQRAGHLASYDASNLQMPERREDGSYTVPIRILRIHMEEDAAKMVHVGGAEGRITAAAESLVDYNRCGTPLIELVTEPDLRTPEEARESGPVEVRELDYPHPAACRIPTKVTATQLKGRELDEEIAQGTVRRVRQVQVETPRFLIGERPLSAAQRGTAMHLLMQYLDLSGPEPEQQVQALLVRHLLTPEQAASLELEQVRRFLASPLAERIRRAGEVYREYRFSLLLPASLYDPEAEPEDELMLQGVVDCAFRTEQGLVIVDFKTDRILPQEAAQRAELYRPQLTAYSQALSRVLEAPVAERVLYFFGPGCQVTL